MARLSFHIEDVKKLVEELASTNERNATMDHLFDGQFYPNGKPLDEQGRTEREAELAGDMWWPSASQIDTSKIPEALQIVGDQGVYLLNNVKSEQSPAERRMLAYAKGCNPELDDDWYDVKVNKFGGDDGSVTIPVDWARHAIKKGSKLFKVELGSRSVRYVP